MTKEAIDGARVLIWAIGIVLAIGLSAQFAQCVRMAYQKEIDEAARRRETCKLLMTDHRVPEDLQLRSVELCTWTASVPGGFK